jgi:hypothetical protein
MKKINILICAASFSLIASSGHAWLDENSREALWSGYLERNFDAIRAALDNNDIENFSINSDAVNELASKLELQLNNYERGQAISDIEKRLSCLKDIKIAVFRHNLLLAPFLGIL